MTAQKRNGKFYRKNEKEVMESLGLRATLNSGSGWVEKEDGENDYILCQLKSTDAQSIKVNQKDIRVLESNAAVAHKYPVFAIQFLNTGEIWLMAKPEDFPAVSEFINAGETEKPEPAVGWKEETIYVEKKKIISSKKARERYEREREKEFERRRKCWKV